jgi:hypothetical protein
LGSSWKMRRILRLGAVLEVQVLNKQEDLEGKG